jgi:hypothetical protein
MANAKRNHRCVIYPKDVALIMGNSERSARHLIAKIKRSVGKEPDQILTIREFCKYMGISEEEVYDVLM